MNRLAQLVREQLSPLSPDDEPNLPRPLKPASRSSPVSTLRDAYPWESPAKLFSLAGANRDHAPVSPLWQDRVLVGTASLEAGLLPLHQQIYEFGRRVRAAGMSQLKLVPLFLMQGVHVMEDIPAEVQLARQLLSNALVVTHCPHLGGHPDLATLLAGKLATWPTAGQLLVAHGSRRPKGNRQIETLARSLAVEVAYWSTPPDLETQLINLMQQGYQQLTILPYFLFSGGITDAITQLTEEMAERFPRVSFRLLPPLGATAELAQLVAALCRQGQADVLAS
jgi:sirohydrochlorin ferrochelatase